MKKKYRRIVDNRMKWYGETDTDKKIIKVNKRKSKNKPTHKKRHPEVLDTIVHEETHARHPEMHEKTVRIETRNKLKRMAENNKRKFYGLYR